MKFRGIIVVNEKNELKTKLETLINPFLINSVHINPFIFSEVLQIRIGPSFGTINPELKI